ncbi:MBL fold metallo-hydrolase [Cohnella terricola]|uniref:Ribonuclease Z n=1 Tax=Cohnella terricola TaxID=1289167 RepID=A0A559JL91_9BACL|nr:MBL fold metallo-hydrolase [Cohnella terricola]TVY00632.1 ribonuclease Z [Cohnella terricola]
MNIQMLGTGSAFAKSFFNNNALITVEGRKLLLDCGITAPSALHQLGVSFNDLDAVLITHIHGDHMGGLEELGFQMKFVYSRKPILYIADTLVEPLWEHSLKGGMWQQEFQTLDDYFDVRPLTPGVSRELMPGLSVEPILTPHIPNKPSYSMLFNGSFFYSGDTVFDAELLTSLVRSRGVKVIFHDCQLHGPGIVHACLSELLMLPDDLQERIYLMHYGDDQPDFIGRTGQMEFIEQHIVYELERLTRTE